MRSFGELKGVKPEPGRPLYLTVRDTLRDAIRAGTFAPGQRMPSTKHLADRLKVSLVTTHRALTELVGSGVLQRSQGKGTFVHEQFLNRLNVVNDLRIGLILRDDASFVDLHHAQIVEGLCKAAQEVSVDVIHLRFKEDVRDECQGFLMIHPMHPVMQRFISHTLRKPTMVIGTCVSSKFVRCIDVDHNCAGQQAVNHLVALGHRSIGYVGSIDHARLGHERWHGFIEACHTHDIVVREHHILRCLGWRLDDRENMALIRMLSNEQRPTAIIAADFTMALGVCAAARSVGLRVPEQLSVIGVEDPIYSPYIEPALTTLRQPLVQLGREAIKALVKVIQNPSDETPPKPLPAELIVRGSTCVPCTK